MYAQFTDGVGTFDLLVEMRHVLDDGQRRTVGYSRAVRIDFPGGNQILIVDTAFHLEKAPFREPGLFEFVVTCDGEVLSGMAAEVRMLDRRAVI